MTQFNVCCRYQGVLDSFDSFEEANEFYYDMVKWNSYDLYIEEV